MRELFFDKEDGTKVYEKDGSYFIEYFAWIGHHDGRTITFEVSKEDAERAIKSDADMIEVIDIYTRELPKGIFRLAEFRKGKYKIIVYKYCDNADVVSENRQSSNDAIDCEYEISMEWKDSDSPYEKHIILSISKDDLSDVTSSGDIAFSRICKSRGIAPDFEIVAHAWNVAGYDMEVFKTEGKYVLNYSKHSIAIHDRWSHVDISKEDFLNIQKGKEDARIVLEKYLDIPKDVEGKPC